MSVQESGQMYLETILILSKTKEEVHAVDIGERMGFSKPSVSRAMGNLKAGGYIETAPKGAITLTDAGRAIAEKIYERHMLIAEALRKIGVDADQAAEDACKIEHDISDVSFHALKTHLNKINGQ